MPKISELVFEFEKLNGHSDFEFGAKSPPASDEQIMELEKELGETLPADFKEFYQITNGWYSIDGRYMDINPIEEVISDLNDSETKSLALIGASGPNDFYIFMHTPKATGKGICFVIEDWFEEVQLSEENLKGLSEPFREKLLKSSQRLDDGKYLSPPMTFTQVLEHLLKYNATQG